MRVHLQQCLDRSRRSAAHGFSIGHGQRVFTSLASRGIFAAWMEVLLIIWIEGVIMPIYGFMTS